MIWLLSIAPLFILFEIAQLVVAERYLGIKQMATGRDPRSLPMSEKLAFAWTAALFFYWIWIGMLLANSAGRMQALAIFGLSISGLWLRRNLARRWALVVLTFEGALRMGMLISLTSVFWKQIR
jgi:hypothetical protein